MARKIVAMTSKATRVTKEDLEGPREATEATDKVAKVLVADCGTVVTMDQL